MAYSHIRDDLAAHLHGSPAAGPAGYVGEGGTSRALSDALADLSKIRRFEALGQMSEAQYLQLLECRGGCACNWPNAAPPCSRCTEPPTFSEANELGWLDEDEIELPSWLQGPIRNSDRPGIVAMAAKRVQSPPQPPVSIDGVELNQAELLKALQIIRVRKSQPVSTPRGLLVVAGFDHRLGRWNEEV